MDFLLREAASVGGTRPQTHATDGFGSRGAEIRPRLDGQGSVLLPGASRDSLDFPLFTDYSQSNEDNAEAVSPPRHTVVSDGVLAIIAGSDTTSSVICNAIWAILQRPDVYQRLQAEVDKFYPPGEDSLDGKRIYDMPYLEAVM